MPQYDSGLAANLFAHNPDGSVYEGPVWPSNAEKNPANSVFPDFSKPAARQWWGTLFKPLVDVGVAGIWNDMNEPAVFNNATGTMPLDVKFDNEGQPSDHREIHNVYGLLMTRGHLRGPEDAAPRRAAVRADARDLRRRPALCRAVARRQRLGLDGDARRDSHAARDGPVRPVVRRRGRRRLRRSAIAGALHALAAERAALSVLRTHTTFGTPDQEPWSYGLQWEAYQPARDRDALRAAPADLQRHARHDGDRAAGDASARARVPGRSGHLRHSTTSTCSAPICCSPRCCAKARRRAGSTCRRADGSRSPRAAGSRAAAASACPVTMDSIPLFARAGAFVFRQPVVQHTGQMPGQPLIVEAYGGASGSGSLYEDDGLSFKFEQGQSMTRKFTQTRGDGSVTISVAAGDGQWRPAARPIRLRRAGRRHAVSRRPERHGDFARRRSSVDQRRTGGRERFMEPGRARLRRRRNGRYVRRDDARDRALAAACASASTLAGRRSRPSSSTTTGAIAFRERRATPRGDYDGTIEAIAGLVDEAERSIGARCSVGIGMPGAISPATGVVKNANSTWLNGRHLHEDLEARLSRPVRLANDANCFALSEASDGAGAGAETVFGVILGTGCGGGVVVRGGVLTGPNAVAGEWGHNPLPWPRDDERPGPPCYCGKHGCLETFVSGTGLALDYETHTGTRDPSRPKSSRARPAATRPREPRSTATWIASRAASRPSSTCSIPTSSCWAAACRTSRRCTGRFPCVCRSYVFSDRRRHADRPAEARRLERCPRRRLAVAGRSTVAIAVAQAFRPAPIVESRRRHRGRPEGLRYM